MHTHGHAASEGVSKDKGLALLAYMLDHNQHHAEELHELGHNFEGEASTLIHDAVDLLNESNDKIAQALAILQD